MNETPNGATINPTETEIKQVLNDLEPQLNESFIAKLKVALSDQPLQAVGIGFSATILALVIGSVALTIRVSERQADAQIKLEQGQQKLEKGLSETRSTISEVDGKLQALTNKSAEQQKAISSVESAAATITHEQLALKTENAALRRSLQKLDKKVDNLETELKQLKAEDTEEPGK